jgi:hypothetical protein
MAWHILIIFWAFNLFGQQYTPKMLVGDQKNISPALALEVNSTSLSSRPCPNQSDAQRSINDTANPPSLGDCYFSTDSKKWKIFDGAVWRFAGLQTPFNTTPTSIAIWGDSTGSSLLGTNSTIDANGLLTTDAFLANSTTQASRPEPLMTTAQIQALTGVPQGAEVFNSDIMKDQFYDGTSWFNSPYFKDYLPSTQYYKGDYILDDDLRAYRANANFVSGANIKDDIFDNSMDFLFPPDWTTSAFSGGVISKNGSNYDVTKGQGLIVKNNNSPFPQYIQIAWPAATSLPLADSSQWNTVYITDMGSGIGQAEIVAGMPNEVTYKTHIVIGLINGTNGDFYNLNGPALDAGATVRDLGLFLGVMKNGINFTGNTNKGFLTSSGKIYYEGVDALTENPNIKSCGGQTITSFNYYNRSSLVNAADTTIDTGVYDNNGMWAAYTAGYWGCAKLFLNLDCSIAAQYCQSEWPTLTAAISGEETNRSSYVLNPVLKDVAKYVGIVFFSKGAVDFTDSSVSHFVNCGILGCGTAGSGLSASTGDVLGPLGASDMALARFSGTTGKSIQDSQVILDDLGNMTGINNLSITGVTTFNVGANSSTFPTNRGTAQQFLQTDGLGTLSWQTAGDVLGPATSSVGTIAIFANGTGKRLNDSGISTNNLVTAPSPFLNGTLVRGDGSRGLLNTGINSADVVTAPTAFTTADRAVVVNAAGTAVKEAPYALPTAAGANGEAIISNGTGGSAWGVVASGGTVQNPTGNYTIVTGDCGGTVSVNSATAATVTMGAIKIGCTVWVVQQGAGQVTIAGSGVTLGNGFGLFKTRTQYSVISIYQVTASLVIVAGDVN